MNVNRLKLIYFSPTGTTQKVLESIARGIGAENIDHIDLTLPGRAQQTISSFSDELVLIGAPVYGGRLPVEAVKRFKQLRANHTLAILIVVYGNRDFDDALVELKNLAIEIGFVPIAAGVFIGEHSFATRDIPIGTGRPDNLDVQRAIEFGKNIRKKITALQSRDSPMDVNIPGRFPYESTGARPMAVSPVTNADTCTLCTTCASVCPTAAIAINGSVSTEVELCIRCCACIKNCPTSARVMEDGPWKNIARWLNENCSIRKEPQVFGIDV